MSQKKWKWKDSLSSVYGRMGMVFLAASAVSVLVFLADNKRELPKNENGKAVVSRNKQGEGSREEEYQVEIGELEKTFKIEISEERYTDKELQRVFESAEEEIKNQMLGENESLDEVRSDLNLITELPGTGIDITWELGSYSVMNSSGTLKTENLTEDGTEVELKAILTYGEEQCEYLYSATVFPVKLTEEEQVLETLENEVLRLNEETSTEAELVLPDIVNGEVVSWGYVTDFRAVGIWLMGIALSLLVYASEEQKKKDAKKNREKALAYDYPQLISKFTLYIKAGMTPKNAWYRIAEDYERKKAKTGRKEVYEEMAFTMQEMRSGASERECYEQFGERCRLPAYRKFAAMLSQNLKKGTKGMTDLLTQEAQTAFEERKSMAKMLGEEAGTKMLLPMFMMLAVVLVMIIIPAFLTVQL